VVRRQVLNYFFVQVFRAGVFFRASLTLFVCYCVTEIEDSWVFGRDVSDDLIEDFEKGLEYARMAKVLSPPSYSPGNANTKPKNRPRLVKVRIPQRILRVLFCFIPTRTDGNLFRLLVLLAVVR
jgi:hypothetical protein